MNAPEHDPLRPIAQLARELECNRSRLYYWAKQGWLATKRIKSYHGKGFIYLSNMAAVEAANRHAAVARQRKGLTSRNDRPMI